MTELTFTTHGDRIRYIREICDDALSDVDSDKLTERPNVEELVGAIEFIRQVCLLPVRAGQ